MNIHPKNGHENLLPSHFLGAHLHRASVKLYDSTWRALVIVDEREMRKLIALVDGSSGELTETVGTPRYVAIADDKLLVWPRPERRMQVRLEGMMPVLA